MRLLRGGIYFWLLCGGVLCPAVLAAHPPQASSSAQPALNEQQTTGRKLFNQNCRLCHTPEPERAKDPTPGKSVGPSLVGVFGPPRSRPEVVVRTFIQQGIADKMPGFRYGLQPAEIDAIVAYLKTL
ncbi:MAG: c-type cytochrome [Terriglobia bacterium]